MRRRSSLLWLLPLVTSGLACGDAPLTPREPDPGAVSLHVTSYNIKFERAEDEATIEAVGAIGSDVLGLQEVNAKWQAVLGSRYQSAYPYMLFAPKENAGGLGVLSRYPLIDHGVIQPPNGIHPGWVFDVQLPTVTVQIVLVHLRSLFNGEHSPVGNFLEVGDLHRSEMEEFFARVDPQKPTVVLGDFNEGIDGAAVRWLEDRGYRNTLHLFRPGQFTWIGRSVGNQYSLDIDHVMAGPSFELLDARIDRIGKSDHLPVTAFLQLPP